MATNVTSIAKARTLQLERKYSEIGRRDLGLLVERLEHIFDNNTLDSQGEIIKELLFKYVRHIQQHHPVMADVIQMSFDDSSFKMLLPKPYIVPSDMFDVEDAWYFGLTVESSNHHIPDITLSPRVVETSINTTINGCNCNFPLMLEPVGTLISYLLSQGYHLTLNQQDSDQEGYVVAMENGITLVTMWFNLAVLHHATFKTTE